MWHRLLAAACAVALGLVTIQAVGESDLAAEFQQPPETARPWVYWFWMNGNITREGITADLEAMHKVGIGGSLIMHVKLGDIGESKLGNMPPDGPITFMSDEFRGLFRHAVAEAARLGMKIDMNNADGFTGSGGPWVPVEKSMKKLVWSEIGVTGGKRVTVELPQPETLLDFYRDVTVIAYPRQPSLYDQMKAAGPTFSASGPRFRPGAIADDNPATQTAVAGTGLKDGPHLLISFVEPYTADTLVLRGARVVRGPPTATLEVSDDGMKFRPVGPISLKWYPAAPTNTIRFDAEAARHFRIRFAAASQQVTLGDVALGRSNRLHYWEPKAGFTRFGEWGGDAELITDRKTTPAAGQVAKADPETSGGIAAITRSQVVELSGMMKANGELAWDAPPGEWTVLRIGYTTTGIKNHPASAGGHGLECDKLHPAGVEAAFAGMLDKLIADNKDQVGRSFTHAHIDSWEVGIQNWTEGLAETFKQMNGYDLAPFYPLLVAGHAVESSEASERFLWDLRRTLLAMMAENYLGRIQSLCHEKGLFFSSEAAGRQTFLHNPVGLLVGSDLPMGEFWPHEGAPRVDGKAAASVAHLYDKPLVGAEAFTGGGAFANWDVHPYRLKQIGDEAFCLGINHFVIHYCVHQAYEGFRPGFAMGPWGIHLDRMNTWWEQSKAWLEYLARCQHMLRQGQFVADVLYFPGEGAPHYLGKRESLSLPLPVGYDFDGCDRQTLLERITVKDGRLIAPSGMSYRYLMLSDDRTMTPELARRVRSLVEAGATVIGPKPIASPSLRDYPECDEEVRQIADALWDSGRVIWGKRFEEIAAEDGLAPDFGFTSASAEAKVHYIHRRLGDTDLYFVANGADEAADIVAEFRVSGRRPELWDPETGRITRPAVFEEIDGRVRLAMHLERLASVFVVFREPASETHVVGVAAMNAPAAPDHSIVLTQDPAGGVQAMAFAQGAFELSYSDGSRRTIKVASLPESVELSGPWQVRFPTGWNAPEQIELDKLISWTEHENFGIRHFSGTASYRTAFERPAVKSDERVFLDLGDVQVIAEVALNGRELGTLWKPPFRVDITDALKPGENELVVRVTNLWTNRLVGDEQFPDDAQWAGLYLQSWPDWFLARQPRPEPRRKAFTVVRHYDKMSPLLPSGLLGPVRLTVARTAELP